MACFPLMAILKPWSLSDPVSMFIQTITEKVILQGDLPGPKAPFSIPLLFKAFKACPEALVMVCWFVQWETQWACYHLLFARIRSLSKDRPLSTSKTVPCRQRQIQNFLTVTTIQIWDNRVLLRKIFKIFHHAKIIHSVCHSVCLILGGNGTDWSQWNEKQAGGITSFHQSKNQNTEQEGQREIQGCTRIRIMHTLRMCCLSCWGESGRVYIQGFKPPPPKKKPKTDNGKQSNKDALGESV